MMKVDATDKISWYLMWDLAMCINNWRQMEQANMTCYLRLNSVERKAFDSVCLCYPSSNYQRKRLYCRELICDIQLVVTKCAPGDHLRL